MSDWPEISELPRIGPTLAKRIVQHRQQHGPFQRLEDLRQIRGIGPKTLEAMRPYLTPLPEGTVGPQRPASSTDGP